MTGLIILLGGLTVLAGIVIFVQPEVMVTFLRNSMDKPLLYILAVVVRLILGTLLVYQSGLSRFPLAIEIIGWITLVGAVVLVGIGRRNFTRFIQWILSFGKTIYPLGGTLSVVLGAFLVYAFF